MKVVQKCSSPIVKVVHGDNYHLLTLPSRQLDFSYYWFHGRVRNVFKFPQVAQFAFSYKEPGFCGPDMTVANDEELKYALVQASPSHLQLDIRIIEEDNRGRKHSCSHVVKIRHNGTLRALSVSLTEAEFSYEQFQSRIRDIFKLPCSAKFLLSYVDTVGDNITISEGDNLKDTLLPLSGKVAQLDMTMIEGGNNVRTQKTSPYVVKVMHKDSLRRLTLAPDDLPFSYEKLRSRIRDLFKLPVSAQFLLSYIDEDQDNISMVGDEDLRDALVLQLLHPLMVNMTIVEGHNLPIAPNQANSDEVIDKVTEGSVHGAS